MGLKRRFKIKRQQRWKRRKARQKLAVKSEKQVQLQAPEPNTPQQPSGETSTPSVQAQ